MSGTDSGEAELDRLKKRLARELRARAESEAIGEKALRDLFRKQKEIELLRLIAVSANEASTIEDAMQFALDKICAHTGWPVGHVYLPAGDSTGELAPTTLWHMEHSKRFETFRKITAELRFPPGIGLPGRVLESGNPLWIMDVTKDSNFPRAKCAQDIGVRAAFGFPVLAATEVVGVLEFFSPETQEPDPSLLETMANVGTVLGRVIERKRAEEALRESEERYRALVEVSQTVSSTLDLHTVLATIVAHAVRLAGAHAGVIYEYDEITQEFHSKATDGLEEQLMEALRAAPISRDEGVVGKAAETKEPVQSSDLLVEHGLLVPRVRSTLVHFGYRSILAVPLLREEQIVGSLVVLGQESRSFPTKAVNLLQSFATQSVLAIQNARLFREIEEKKLQLEVVSRHKSEFLATMSHELRTPLNAVIGFSEVLLDEMFGKLNTKQREYVQDILTSGRHLLSLINDILDLAKIEAGRMELELSTFDLPTLAESTLMLIRERANSHGLQINLEMAPQLGDVTADERKVKQILLNLLSNAMKFTLRGGHIAVRAVQQDGMVAISVSDTGIGIASEDQAIIFEQFRQARGGYARKHEGTGLGLALVKKFVELHGGQIWLETEVSKGSTFTFTLPLLASGKARHQTPGTSRAMTSDESSLPLVLVVEDDPASTKLLSLYLKEAGFVVEVASDGETGFEKSQMLRPALIMLDILLPKVDGWELLTRLKDNPATAPIPVVIVSILDDGDKGFALGAKDYLVKPVNRENLIRVVKQFTSLAARDIRAVKILAIDDDPMVLELISAVVGPTGYTMLKARGGREGLSVAREHKPDLIVLDLIMPEMDGFQVLEELKRESHTADIPVVILTAKTLTSEDKVRLNGLISDHMQKVGFDRDEFLRHVRSLVL